MSPELTQRIEANRQAALAKRRQFIASEQAEQKDKLVPQQWRPSASSSYVDCDISNMKDNKAGFLADELQQPQKKKRVVYDHELFPVLLTSQNESESHLCKDCLLSTDLDTKYRVHYGLFVCNSCVNTKPEKYTLLTKTEVIQDYLITSEHLTSISVSSDQYNKNPQAVSKDKILRFWEKDNPRQNTYARMHLYARCQVEDYIFPNVWASEQALDSAFEDREQGKKKRAHSKRQASIKEMRKRVMTSQLQSQDLTKKSAIIEKHIHRFNDNNQCIDCKLLVEEEEF